MTKVEKKVVSDKMLKVFFENREMKEVFLKFFDEHGHSFEQYMELNLAQDFKQDSDPLVMVGKNSLSVQKFNKSKGAVIDIDGNVEDYQNIKTGSYYLEIATKGIELYEKKSLVEKDRLIGAAGDLAVALTRLNEVSKTSEGLDLAVEKAKQS